MRRRGGGQGLVSGEAAELQTYEYESKVHVKDINIDRPADMQVVTMYVPGRQRRPPHLQEQRPAHPHRRSQLRQRLRSGGGQELDMVMVTCVLQDGYYGVYGRISYYRTWIEGKMSSPKYCPSGANAGA